MGVEDKSKSSSTARLALWLSFIAFVLLIVVFHSTLSEITFGEKGVSAKMMNAQDASKLSSQDRQVGEQALNERISSLEKQAREHPQAAPPAQSTADIPASGELSNATYRQSQDGPPATINLAGWWGAADGTTYQISQIGNYVGMQGYYGGYRFVVGTGQIWGQNMALQTQALTGQTGTLSLEVSPDQRHLTGSFQNAATGQITYAQFNR